MTPDTETETAEFVRKERVSVVTMPPERANQSFLNTLTNLGARVYLHTINSPDEIKGWRKKGVWGFYTDSVLPSDMK